MRLQSIAHVTTGATATLGTLLAAATPPASIIPNVVELELIPDGVGVYEAMGGAASASSSPIPVGGVSDPMDAADAATLQFYAGSSIGLTVKQYIYTGLSATGLPY